MPASSRNSNSSSDAFSDEAHEVANDEPVFRYGTPAVAGKMFPCFRSRANGLLFRIVLADGSWAYFNDTKKYNMHVLTEFTGSCEIEPLGETVIIPEDQVGRVLKGKKPDKVTPLPPSKVVTGTRLFAYCKVKPTQTAPFMRGKMVGFKCNYTARRKGLF